MYTNTDTRAQTHYQEPKFVHMDKLTRIRADAIYETFTYKAMT